MLEVQESCEICGEVRTEPTRFVNVLGTGLDLRRCVGCGVKYFPGVTKAAIVQQNDNPAAHAHVDNTIDRGAMDRTEDDPAETVRTREIVRGYYGGMLAALRKYVDPIESAFEVGCGGGRFLALLADEGCRVGGCDANKRASERLPQYGVQHAYFSDAEVPTGLDLVVMVDVIEHTHTPRADLQQALASLRPGGGLIVKTFYDEWHDTFDVECSKPEHWWSPRRGYFGPPSHLYHFDIPVLVGVIERVGFKVVEQQVETAYGQVTIYGVRP